MSRRKTHIGDLPDELLEKVFAKLPLWSQCEAKGVCKLWKRKLSSIKSRAAEGWILIDCSDYFRWYNVSQNRWVKKMELDNLPSPMNRADTFFAGCVFQELLIFVNHSGLTSCWNAVTNESRVLLEVKPPPGNIPLFQLQYGVCSDASTGDIKLLLYNNLVRSPLGQLWSCEVPVASRGVSWERCSKIFTEVRSYANFNSLTPSNRLVPFKDCRGGFCLYDVDKDCLETLVESESPAARLLMDDIRYRETLHFEKHGSFVVGETLSRQKSRRGLVVKRYDPEKREFEIVSETPEGLV